MTDEEKKIAEDAKKVEEAKVAEDAKKALEATEGASHYKKLYEDSETEHESTKETLKKAEYKLNEKRLKEKEEKGEEEEEEAKADAPSVEEITKSVRASIAKEDSEDFRKTLSTLITDKDELAEVEYHLDNTIKSSGNDQRDLELAMQLANVKKTEAMAGEIAKAKGRNPITKNVPGNPPKDGEKELNKKEQSFSDAIDALK